MYNLSKATYLIQNFISIYLNGDIENLAKFDFFLLEQDKQFGCPGRNFDPDDTNLATGDDFMIELNGVYKLKKIKGLKNNDDRNYKVIAILSKNTVVCENESNEHFYFMKDFLIDPEFPENIYLDIQNLELS